MTDQDRGSERRISVVLDDAFARLCGETVTLQALIEPLRERAFGLVLLILVLPNCLPIPGIPFVSTVTGIPICLVALQLIAGRHSPLLPRWIATRQMRRAPIVSAWARIRPAILWLENFIVPRHPALVAWRMEQAMAVVIFVLGFILALPLFGGNLLPAWGVLLLALAIIERDGVIAIAGWIMSVVALAWIAVLLYFGSQLFGYLWQQAKHWILMII